MSDVAVPTVSKPVLILYVAVLVLLGALVAVWLVQALQSPAGAPEKKKATIVANSLRSSNF